MGQAPHFARGPGFISQHCQDIAQAGSWQGPGRNARTRAPNSTYNTHWASNFSWPWARSIDYGGALPVQPPTPLGRGHLGHQSPEVTAVLDKGRCLQSSPGDHSRTNDAQGPSLHLLFQAQDWQRWTVGSGPQAHLKPQRQVGLLLA